MKMNAYVSVVVPVFNIAECLERCLDSLVYQTYKEMEVLLIDDGSTDGSSEICRGYAKRYANFTYYRKVNGGLSDARNFGISKAAGNYIAFVDGDDYVASDFIEMLMNAFKDERVDISICSYQIAHGENLKPFWIEDETIEGVKAMKRLIARQRLVDVVAWNKLYKKSLFDGVEYPVGRLHEDVFTTYRLLADSRAVRYINVPAYCYVQRQGSIMSSMTRERLKVLDAEEEIRVFCRNRRIDADVELEAFGIATRIALLARIAKSDKYKELRSEYGQLRKSLSLTRCIANPYISMKQVLVYTACAVVPYAITLMTRCRAIFSRGH